MEEHQEIDTSLKNLQQTKQLKKAQQLLLAAVTYSRKHFDKEERIVFPMAERVLNGKTLAALGQSWMEQRTRAAIVSA
ncbi:MAG: hemerythrin domain-containing protein [Verrucomicrobia bacterium]|nr:hemerythrin domain-containing protein [Verrucomicrobiota bacterium]